MSRRIRTLLLSTLVGLAIVSVVSPMPGFAAETSVWSFNMWCIEMEMLPAERCRERRPEDEMAYQAYISRTERFEQQMDEDARRQAEAQEQMDRENPNPGAIIP